MDKEKKHLNDRVLIYAVIWCISYVGSLFVLKTLNISKESGIVLTIITVLAFVLFIYKYYRSIYFMDEVQIKIQMEAVIIAFSLGLVLILVVAIVLLFSLGLVLILVVVIVLLVEVLVVV